MPFSGITGLTWIVLLSLLIGKTIGITAFSYAGERLGFKLPDGMRPKHLVVTGVVAGLGLTVALFVSGQAFVAAGTQGAAKMGALFSGGIALLAFALGSALNVRDVTGDRKSLLAGLTSLFKPRAFESATRMSATNLRDE